MEATKQTSESNPPEDNPAWAREVNRLFRAERSGLLGFIRRRIPDAQEAEDMVQDVFYQLMDTLQRTVPIRQVRAWLFQVSRNKIADRYRKEGARPGTDSLSEDTEDRVLLAWMQTLGSAPEETLFRDGMWEALQEALQELPDHQRWVFEQHELEGRSYKELAADTGESVNTLLSRKRYAVLYLRDALQAWYDDL